MAIIPRLTNISRYLKCHMPIYNVTRCYAEEQLPPWNRYWMPGPKPKTEEERIAAAEKYGLHPSEYETYDIHKDGFELGDYPKLPKISADNKDPYEPYDYPELRRNYNEPIHFAADVMGEDRYSYYGVRDRHSLPYMLGVLGAILGTYGLLFWFFQTKPMFHPVMRKQYPVPDTVHYTFEPAK